MVAGIHMAGIMTASQIALDLHTAATANLHRKMSVRQC
jgi:hypothetical protein